MKKDIHPDYVDCTVTCTCGNTFKTKATKPELKIDICNVCHPFYTGTQKLIDTGGRVQRFSDRFGSATDLVKEREAAKKAERAARIAAEEEERASKRAEKAKAKEERAAKYAEENAKAEVKKAEETPAEITDDAEVSAEETPVEATDSSTEEVVAE